MYGKREQNDVGETDKKPWFIGKKKKRVMLSNLVLISLKSKVCCCISSSSTCQQKQAANGWMASKIKMKGRSSFAAVLPWDWELIFISYP